MISQGLKMLKRAIDERPKGGMQTGMPKIQLRESDAVRAVAELEWAQSEIELLKEKAVPDGYITIPAQAWHEQVQIEKERDELVATVERLRDERNKLAQIVDNALECAFDGCDYHAADIQEHCLYFGITESTAFDSNVHADYNAVLEDGDEYHQWSDWFTAIMRETKG